ncbi:Aste57867_6976 [Aphanomyces stellatus]|uniref:Aste57867_6976 protein n=1 Tax=Aphanomyces stellatus TaxID=120398 RepID=A0A485KFC0_9STRA|nr:hypothetical protein As57867_006953 [Aphanomyces stellatus]VFT83928.1 Aste57867_6976 [Aphanomyces stellatus]
MQVCILWVCPRKWHIRGLWVHCSGDFVGWECVAWDTPGKLGKTAHTSVHIATDDWRKLLHSCTIPRLAPLFDKLTCLQVGSTQRRASLKQCLEAAMVFGRYDLMQWLVETQTMEPLDVRATFASVKVAGEIGHLDLCGMDMAEFLTKHDVQFTRDCMLQIMCAYMRQTKLVDWNAWRIQPHDSIIMFAVSRFFNVLVKEEGSEAAVVGRCIQYLVASYPTPGLTLLRRVYQLWQSMLLNEDDVAKKRTIETEMLDEAKEMDRKAIVRWLLNETSAAGASQLATGANDAANRPTRRRRHH